MKIPAQANAKYGSDDIALYHKAMKKINTKNRRFLSTNPIHQITISSTQIIN